MIQQMCSSYLLELHQGIHVWDTDEMRIALYEDGADIDTDTTAYSTTDEVTGAGYIAGGKILLLADDYPMVVADGDSRQLLLQFQDVIWPGASFSARSALIYNASKANRAVAAIDLLMIRTPVSQSFSIEWPTLLDVPWCIRLGA